jgi:hypothetical protein
MLWGEWALTVGNRDQRQRRVPACKTPLNSPGIRCTVDGRINAAPDCLVATRTWLTLATAVPATREAHILALQVERLHNIVEPPKSALRK